jgi:hypothetical protein
MAIIVEEERAQSNFSNVIGWIIIALIAALAAYFVFFAPAPEGTFTPPAAFEVIAPVAQINFDPSTVTSNPNFQSLKQYVAEPTSTGPAPVGREDPFIGQ